MCRMIVLKLKTVEPKSIEVERCSHFPDIENIFPILPVRPPPVKHPPEVTIKQTCLQETVLHLAKQNK